MTRNCPIALVSLRFDPLQIPCYYFQRKTACSWWYGGEKSLTPPLDSLSKEQANPVWTVSLQALLENAIVLAEWLWFIWRCIPLECWVAPQMLEMLLHYIKGFLNATFKTTGIGFYFNSLPTSLEEEDCKHRRQVKQHLWLEATRDVRDLYGLECQVETIE